MKRIVAVVLLLFAFNAQPQIKQEAESSCLAKAVYYEARGESKQGMLAVAQVVINRHNKVTFPSGICNVVYQKYQFSWVGMKLPKPYGKEWILANQIAKESLRRGYAVREFPAIYFHSGLKKPKWKYKLVARVGNHYFYV